MIKKIVSFAVLSVVFFGGCHLDAMLRRVPGVAPQTAAAAMSFAAVAGASLRTPQAFGSSAHWGGQNQEPQQSDATPNPWSKRIFWGAGAGATACTAYMAYMAWDIWNMRQQGIEIGHENVVNTRLQFIEGTRSSSDPKVEQAFALPLSREQVDAAIERLVTQMHKCGPLPFHPFIDPRTGDYYELLYGYPHRGC